MRPIAAATRFAACVAAVLAAASPVANAQSRFGTDSFIVYPAASTLQLADQPDTRRLQARFNTASSSSADWLSSTVQLDRPRAAANGTYTRPKLMVGLPSTQMRGWLRAAGVEAERCQLPMLRARTSMATGDLQGTLWLYARCSFH